MSNIQPYRFNSIVLERTGGLTHGLIKAPKPEPKHKCKPPGLFKCIFSGVRKNSLYKCSTCSIIYKYGGFFDNWSPYISDRDALSAWIKIGGLLTERDEKIYQFMIDKKYNYLSDLSSEEKDLLQIK